MCGATMALTSSAMARAMACGARLSAPLAVTPWPSSVPIVSRTASTRAGTSLPNSIQLISSRRRVDGFCACAADEASSTAARRRRIGDSLAKVVAQPAQRELGLHIGDLAAQAGRQRRVEIDPTQARALFERGAVERRRHRTRALVGADLARDQQKLLGAHARGGKTGRAQRLHPRRVEREPGLFVRLGDGALT